MDKLLHPVPYEKINLDNVPIPDHLNGTEKKDLLHWNKKLREIKVLLDKAVAIQKNTDLPEKLNLELADQKYEFETHYNSLFEINRNLTTAEYATQKSAAISRVNSYYSSFFELSSSNRRLLLLNTVLNFDKESLENYLGSIPSLKSDLEESIARSKILNTELEEKAAKTVVSSYAKIFSTQEDINKKNAILWLFVSLTFSIVLLFLLFLSFKIDLFNITSTEIVKQDGQTFSRMVYNYPNLATKIVMISIALYLITFSFKQYSVNRHLQALNNHRKNALNSYELFVESIGKDDRASKNALMLQVAKAIYENTTTGYLSAKQAENGSHGLMEITKFISEAKN